MIKRVIGAGLILGCGGCLFYGYSQYMDQTEGARAVDDFAQSSGIANILPEDSTKPKMPDETKYALAGAAVAGVIGLALVIRG